MHHHIYSEPNGSAIEGRAVIRVFALDRAAAARENRGAIVILDGPGIGSNHSRLGCVWIVWILGRCGDELCRNIPGSWQMLRNADTFGQAAADCAHHHDDKKRLR